MGVELFIVNNFEDYVRLNYLQNIKAIYDFFRLIECPVILFCSHEYGRELRYIDFGYDMVLGLEFFSAKFVQTEKYFNETVENYIYKSGREQVIVKSPKVELYFLKLLFEIMEGRLSQARQIINNIMLMVERTSIVPGDYEKIISVTDWDVSLLKNYIDS